MAVDDDPHDSGARLPARGSVSEPRDTPGRGADAVTGSAGAPSTGAPSARPAGTPPATTPPGGVSRMTTPATGTPRTTTPPGGTPPTGAATTNGAPVDTTLERGFVASLRWLVSEGDARGVRRIAVELRALREALATLDETRAARDEHARRAGELDREVAAAIAMLGPGTSVKGNGSLVERLTRLRERIREDGETRRQLVVERDAWRSMTTLMTQTRAYVHELLEEAERGRDSLSTEVRSLRDQVLELQISRETAEQEKRVSEETLHALRAKLLWWSGTVERALQQLNKTAAEIVHEHGMHAPGESVAHTPGEHASLALGDDNAVGSADDANAASTGANAPATSAPARKRTYVRRTYLRLTSRDHFRPGRRPRRQAVWLMLPAATVAEWRHLYATIGAEWNWHDRDKWTDSKLAERLASPDVVIFRADAALNGLSDDIERGVGFAELERHDDGSVEIVYFGLTRSAQGFGLGSWLLQRAVDEAWLMGATSVWLHTCTQDSPHALPNYLARGFEVEREEVYEAE